MIEDGQVVVVVVVVVVVEGYLSFFFICFDLIQVKMQFAESLTGGFEVSK